MLNMRFVQACIIQILLVQFFFYILTELLYIPLEAQHLTGHTHQINIELTHVAEQQGTNYGQDY